MNENLLGSFETCLGIQIDNPVKYKNLDWQALHVGISTAVVPADTQLLCLDRKKCAKFEALDQLEHFVRQKQPVHIMKFGRRPFPC